MEHVEATGLARALARMSAVLLSQESVATTVQLVTALANKALPGTAGAGVSLMDAVGKRTTAASDPLVKQADLLQYELDEGPCVTAARDGVVICIDDVETDDRWPAWSEAVAPLGIRSVLSSPMMINDRSIGAVKVYSRQPAAYGEHSRELLSLFAQQAAILLANAQSHEDAQDLTSQLKLALANRDIIGQAKGILIARGARNEETAFAMLVTAARRTNSKLHAVARELLAEATGGAGAGRDVHPGQV